MEAFLAEFGFTVAQLAGVFNILAGMMLIASLGLFLGGGFYYLAYLGLPRRIDGTNYMLHGVRVLFALIIVLGVIRFIQNHVNLMVTILIIAFFILLAWLIYTAYNPATPPSEDDDRH